MKSTSVTIERMIVDQLRRGLSQEQIVENLVKAGYDYDWAARQVAQAIDNLYDAALGNIR